MKLLIIKLGALGDIIISTPIIARLLQHHKGCEICLLTTPLFGNLFSDWEGLTVKVLERKGLINTVRAIKWIRKNDFDRVYDLQSNDRSSLFCSFSGIPLRIGNHPRFPYHKHPAKKYNGECHAFDRLNQILESAGIEKAEPVPYLPISHAVKKKVAGWISSRRLSQNAFVLMHAGSSKQHVKKRWPYFSELAAIIKQSGFDVIWMGGNDDVDLNHQLAGMTGIDASNEFGIAELIELGNHAAFAVTNDSAPMHILSCSNIPVYGLFGPTNPVRNHALGQKQNLISAIENLPENDQGFSPAEISKLSCLSVIQRLKKDRLIK